ncbi:MAG TPA: hypothetical protein VF676_03075 [Flavobacterium sp.]|jgi:hypothetical protein
MDQTEIEIEKYKSAVGLLSFETQFLWTIFSAFLVVHAIFLGFLAQNAFKDNVLFGYNLPCFVCGMVGLVLVLPWYGTFKRNSDFYLLRMAQSRELEPTGWKLIADVGRDFADGKKVQVSGEELRIGFWGRFLRNNVSIPLLICVFFLSYLFITFSSGPWYEKTEKQTVECRK